MLDNMLNPQNSHSHGCLVMLAYFIIKLRVFCSQFQNDINIILSRDFSVRLSINNNRFSTGIILSGNMCAKE